MNSLIKTEIIYRILLNLMCSEDCETFDLNALVGQLRFVGVFVNIFGVVVLYLLKRFTVF